MALSAREMRRFEALFQQQRNEEMMESLAGAVERGIAEFNGQDLANISWSCAKLVWTHSHLLVSVAGEVSRKVLHLDAV